MVMAYADEQRTGVEDRDHYELVESMSFTSTPAGSSESDMTPKHKLSENRTCSRPYCACSCSHSGMKLAVMGSSEFSVHVANC